MYIYLQFIAKATIRPIVTGTPRMIRACCMSRKSVIIFKNIINTDSTCNEKLSNIAIVYIITKAIRYHYKGTLKTAKR